MTTSEFVSELGIEELGEEKANSDFVINLKDSNSYAYYYSLFSRTPLLDLDYENIVVNDKESNLVYLGDDFSVYLSADFESNTYTITIKKE